MKGTEVFRIPGTITVEHYPQQKALLAGWESLSTSQFREALTRGLSAAGRLRAESWLVDLPRNPGVPSQADLTWLVTETGPLTLDAGIRAVINIHGTSTLATLGSKRWSESANQGGLVTCECRSLADALDLALEVAEGKLRGGARKQ